jgi:hypothetical protein
MRILPDDSYLYDLPQQVALQSPAKKHPQASSTELYQTTGQNAGLPSLGDIAQGATGDCSLLTSLGALVESDPGAVKNMIHDDGDGTYTVTFHVQNDGLHNLWGLLGDSYTTVQKTVSTQDIDAAAARGQGVNILTDPGNGKKVLWPAVIEAGFAKLNDSRIFVPGRDDNPFPPEGGEPLVPVDEGIKTGYANINNGADPAARLQNLTGIDADTLGSGPSGATLEYLFDEGKLMVVSTKRSIDQLDLDTYHLIDSHAYTVTKVYTQNGTTYLSLYNPHGISTEPQDIPVSALPRVANEVEAGTGPDLQHPVPYVALKELGEDTANGILQILDVRFAAALKQMYGRSVAEDAGKGVVAGAG